MWRKKEQPRAHTLLHLLNLFSLKDGSLVMADIPFTVSDGDVWQEGQSYDFTLLGAGGHCTVGGLETSQCAN